MRFKFKKIVYLINDVTNLLLKKEQVKILEHALKLRKVLIITIILLVISVILNIYLII